MSKRIFALVLAMAMAVCVFAGCNNTTTTESSAADTSGDTSTVVPAEPSGKVIMGNVTDLTGDFRRPTFAASSPSASDLDVYNLTVGYATLEANQQGNYVWNETVVKSHDVVANDDGTKTFTVEINPGLKYSDGSEVTAKDYIVTTLVFSTNIAGAAGAMSTSAGYTLAGYEEFNAYDGSNDGVAIEETDDEGNVVSSITPSKAFAGVRLLDTYKFAVTVKPDYANYYYAEVYAAFEPTPYKLWLGDIADIADDGNGAYLTDAYYEAEGDSYKIVSQIEKGRKDITVYPFSGPYVIKEYDDSTKQATLEVNPNFAGNFEGQKPLIKTVVYTKIVSETQNDALKSGELDILCDLTGGTDVNAGLAIVEEGEGKYASSNYMRAGYGKIQFVCDFGPTMFTSVRQAISYLLDKDDFADAFCGGYGAVVYGPYAVDSWMYKATKDAIEEGVNEYNFSVADAKKVLQEDGWVYNADGSAYDETAGGVRYKKLTAEEATETNINFVSIENTDGIEYKTVKVGDDYYMPLVINYISTENNEVSELLKVKLTDSTAVKEAGMVIRQTVGTWDDLLDALYHETFIYGMANLATGFTSSIYDQAFYFTVDDALFYTYSNNYLKDPKDLAYLYNDHLEDSVETDMANVDKLGLDYLSMAMVYKATNEEEYAFYFENFVLRWNEMVPEIPLYCNVYYNVYNSKIQGLEGDNALSPYWSFAKALLYCTIAE
ncbi:MAG: hypothetical protein IKK70_00570 [Clostridia bacterium]|nr:hypothetical protein [Clostridia bacterium]